MKPYVYKNGLILGLTFLVIKYIMYIIGLENTASVILYFGTLIALPVVLIYGIKRYREEINAGLISFKEAFGLGMLIVLLAQLLNSLGDVVYMTVIDSGFSERLMELQLKNYEEFGMTDEQIEKQLPTLEVVCSWWGKPLIDLFQKTLGNTVVLLIVAAVVKRNPSYE